MNRATAEHMMKSWHDRIMKDLYCPGCNHLASNHNIRYLQPNGIDRPIRAGIECIECECSHVVKLE